MSKEVIGIVGTISAGKDTAGDYISHLLHIPSFQISSPLKQICLERGIEPNRDNLIILGTQISKEKGDSFLVDHILEHSDERCVITGMRQLGQLATLRSSRDFILISIDARPDIRFQRVINNNKQGEARNIDEFIVKERAENSAPNAQRLFECMALADVHMTNEETIEELYAQLDEIVNIA